MCLLLSSHTCLDSGCLSFNLEIILSKISVVCNYIRIITEEAAIFFRNSFSTVHVLDFVSHLLTLGPGAFNLTSESFEARFL